MATCSTCAPLTSRYTGPGVLSTNPHFVAAVEHNHATCLTLLVEQEIALVSGISARSIAVRNHTDGPLAVDAFYRQQVQALVRMIQLDRVQMAEAFLRACDVRHWWALIPPRSKQPIMAELAVRGSIGMARLLFKATSTFRALNQFPPQTPCSASGAVLLHIAAFHGRIDLLELAVRTEQVGRRKPVLLKRNNRGYSALHFAARGRQLEAVKFLHGRIPIDDESFANETPLHVAIRVGCIAIVRYLLEEAGADPTKVLQKRGGMSVTEIAGKARNSAVIAYLVYKSIVMYDQVQHLDCARWIGLILGRQPSVTFHPLRLWSYTNDISFLDGGE